MSPAGSIRWVVALPAEAAPLIDYFSMSLVHAAPFKVYRSKDEVHWLVVCGIGKVAAAGAAAHLHAVSEATKADAWMNLGIAGHQSAELGTVFLVHKATDRATASTWYPLILFKSKQTTCQVETVDAPLTCYQPGYLYDMEASGYFATVTRFSTQELCHSIKVVSDNATASIDGINRKRVIGWIEGSIPLVGEVVKALLDLSSQEHERLDPPYEMGVLLERWHFSVSQRHELKKLVLRWKALNSELNLLDSDLISARDGKIFLSALREHLAALPPEQGEL